MFIVFWYDINSPIPARLQAAWAEFARRGSLSDQKIKKGTLLRIEKLSFWESAVKICDVAGTPSSYIGSSL